MKRHLYAFVAGVLFASGLAVSEMTRPSKVIGFLDFFGDWDPTMLFVLGPAVGVYLAGVYFAKGRERTGSSSVDFVWLEPEKLNARFFIGSVLFGVGWGLAGVCPGPALMLLGQGSFQVLLFVGVMLMGIVVADWVLKRAS